MIIIMSNKVIIIWLRHHPQANVYHILHVREAHRYDIRPHAMYNSVRHINKLQLKS